LVAASGHWKAVNLFGFSRDKALLHGGLAAAAQPAAAMGVVAVEELLKRRAHNKTYDRTSQIPQRAEPVLTAHTTALDSIGAELPVGLHGLQAGVTRV